MVGLRMFRVAPATRYLGPCHPDKRRAPSLRRALDLGRTGAFLSREERAAVQCALDLLSLVSADDSFEFYPPCLINEVIVDRVVSSEHSIDKRPVERVAKDFQIEIG